MLRRRAPASVALVLWVVLIAVTWTVLARAEGGPAAELARWLAALVRPGIGVPVLLAAYAVRPLLLIPVTVLTAFAGWWWGPWFGFAVAWVGVTASAAVPYALARALRGPAKAAASPRGWRGALGRDPFRTVLVARLMMLPGDLVSAAAGAVRVPWGPFLGATALGGVPGLAVGVLAGASLDDPDVFTWSAVRVDPVTLVAAAAAFALAWGLAWALRRRSRRGALERVHLVAAPHATAVVDVGFEQRPHGLRVLRLHDQRGADHGAGVVEEGAAHLEGAVGGERARPCEVGLADGRTAGGRIGVGAVLGDDEEEHGDLLGGRGAGVRAASAPAYGVDARDRARPQG